MPEKISKVTTDGVLIEDEKILLVRRRYEPFQGRWALPGGFVEYGERTEDAVVREVFEETGLQTIARDLVGVYSAPGRDPRGHTVTIAYHVERKSGTLRSGDDAMDAKFFNINDLPELAFDHAQIIADALRSRM